MPLRGVLFILSSPVSARNPVRKFHHTTSRCTSSIYTLTALHRDIDGICVGVPSIRALHHPISGLPDYCKLSGPRFIYAPRLLSCGARQKGKRMDLEHLMQR